MTNSEIKIKYICFRGSKNKRGKNITPYQCAQINARNKEKGKPQSPKHSTTSDQRCEIVYEAKRGGEGQWRSIWSTARVHSWVRTAASWAADWASGTRPPHICGLTEVACAWRGMRLLSRMSANVLVPFQLSRIYTLFANFAQHQPAVVPARSALRILNHSPFSIIETLIAEWIIASKTAQFRKQTIAGDIVIPRRG